MNFKIRFSQKPPTQFRYSSFSPHFENSNRPSFTRRCTNIFQNLHPTVTGQKAIQALE